MKIKTLIACFILACAATSCIQDEALNSEAAIDACTGDDVQLANINADSKLINVYVNKGADLSKQKLEFVIPEGATIKINDQVAGDTEATYDFSEEHIPGNSLSHQKTVNGNLFIPSMLF